MAETAALYLRVSTVRQVENDLSIPDQRRQTEAYCAARGWTVAAEFVEPGASATDDRRPAFQKMIDAACSPDRPFDIILVHSFSRFYRDACMSELYLRKLAKNGVRLVSITQETGDDPLGQMYRKFLAIMDEYFSQENGKHTLRGMQENARQGYWNGSHAPFGYRVVEAERRGDKFKKRLDITPAEADLVQRIFTLYRHGDGHSGPLGVKAIVNYINEKGFRQHSGARFSIKTVHEMLTRTDYIGRHYFNKFDSKTKKAKPEEDWILVPVPALIEEEAFHEVQALLHSRNPRRTPPRVTSGPTLLIGLAKCATCGGGMTISTGKGGRYRYYACSTCARLGKTACKGRRVPMDKLDGIVTHELVERVLHPERIKDVLSKVIERAANGQDRREEQRKKLHAERRDLESRSARILDAIETGNIDLDDQVKDRLSNLRQRKEENMRLVAMIERQLQASHHVLTPRKLEAFAKAMRGNLTGGNPALRQGYLRLFVDQVVVDDEEIRISGSTSALSNALEKADDFPAGMVPSFVQDWRPQRDSNPRRRRERAVS